MAQVDVQLVVTAMIATVTDVNVIQTSRSASAREA
jgi:hypothetical protein